MAESHRHPVDKSLPKSYSTCAAHLAVGSAKRANETNLKNEMKKQQKVVVGNGGLEFHSLNELEDYSPREHVLVPISRKTAMAEIAEIR